MADDAHIIVRGNPLDGFEFCGPFQALIDAELFAHEHPEKFNGDWWVAALHRPPVAE